MIIESWYLWEILWRRSRIYTSVRNFRNQWNSFWEVGSCSAVCQLKYPCYYWNKTFKILQLFVTVYFNQILIYSLTLLACLVYGYYLIINYLNFWLMDGLTVFCIRSGLHHSDFLLLLYHMLLWTIWCNMKNVILT